MLLTGKLLLISLVATIVVTVPATQLGIYCMWASGGCCGSHGTPALIVPAIALCLPIAVLGGSGGLPDYFIQGIYYFSVLSFALGLGNRLIKGKPRNIFGLQSGPNTCAKCGYNLTGNISSICPECGTVIPTIVNAGTSGKPGG